jgi:hypothetical protein
MTVTAPTSAPVPTLSNTMKVILLTALATAGVWVGLRG